MQSTAKPRAAGGPHDFVVVPSDQVQVAPSDAEITDLLRAAARRSEPGNTVSDPSRSAAVPVVDTTFRATAVEEGIVRSRPSFTWQAIRVLAALVFAIGIGVGWQLFGYAATEAARKWLPQIAQATSLPLDKLGLSVPSQPAEPAAAEETPAQAAPAAAPAASDSATANVAAPPSDTTQQQLQSMARDLASANQEIEALKASIAELKASQQQMIRERAAEQAAAKAKLAATPPHPPTHKPAPVYSPSPTPLAPAPVYRPAPSYSPTQAVAAPPQPAAQPYPSRQIEPPPPIPLQPQAEQPGLASVPRPPMPVTQ